MASNSDSKTQSAKDPAVEQLEQKTIELYHEWVHASIESNDKYVTEVMELLGKVVEKFVEDIDLQRLQNDYSGYHIHQLERTEKNESYHPNCNTPIF